MNPTIQLIQLSMRFERPQNGRTLSFMIGRFDFNFDYLHKLSDQLRTLFNPPRRHSCCECAQCRTSC
ncbi:MAG: hypothetical protein AB8I52_00670 [Candidatus Promineifilaceae bacterium]|jgi:hypothetical protein